LRFARFAFQGRARHQNCRAGFLENFSFTPGFSRVRKVREAKNRLNGFFSHQWFTALKRGVDEMDSTVQMESRLCRN
jgi:hypothetical protein